MTMEENESVHPDYIKGFNEGYELAQMAPEFLETLAKVQSKSERMQGLLDGQKQFIKEKVDRLPDWMHKDYHKNLREKDRQGREKDKGKDKDGIDRIPGE